MALLPFGKSLLPLFLIPSNLLMKSDGKRNVLMKKKTILIVHSNPRGGHGLVPKKEFSQALALSTEDIFSSKLELAHRLGHMVIYKRIFNILPKSGSNGLSVARCGNFQTEGFRKSLYCKNANFR